MTETPPKSPETPVALSTLLEEWMEKLGAARSSLSEAEQAWLMAPKVASRRQPGLERHEALMQVSEAYRAKVGQLREARAAAMSSRERHQSHGFAPVRWFAGRQLKSRQRQIGRLRGELKVHASQVSEIALRPALEKARLEAAEARHAQAEQKRCLDAVREHYNALRDGAGKLMALERAGVAVLDLAHGRGDTGCVAVMDQALQAAEAQRKSPSGNDAALVSRLLLAHRHWVGQRKSDPDWAEEARADMVALGVAIRRRKIARELLASRYGTVWDEVVAQLPTPPTPPHKPGEKRANRRRVVMASPSWDRMGPRRVSPIRKRHHMPRP